MFSCGLWDFSIRNKIHFTVRKLFRICLKSAQILPYIAATFKDDRTMKAFYQTLCIYVSNNQIFAFSQLKLCIYLAITPKIN